MLHCIFNDTVEIFAQFTNQCKKEVLEPLASGQAAMAKKKLEHFDKNLTIVKLLDVLITNIDTLISIQIRLNKSIPMHAEESDKIQQELSRIIKNEWRELLMFKDPQELKKHHPELGIE